MKVVDEKISDLFHKKSKDEADWVIENCSEFLDYIKSDDYDQHVFNFKKNAAFKKIMSQLNVSYDVAEDLIKQALTRSNLR